MSNYKVEISRGKQGDMDRHFPTGTAEPSVIPPKANPSIQRQAQAAVMAGSDDVEFDANNAYKDLSDVNGYGDWDESILEITADDGTVHPGGVITQGRTTTIGGGGGTLTLTPAANTGQYRTAQPAFWALVKNSAGSATAIDIAINGNTIFTGIAAGASQEIRTGGITTLAITSAGACTFDVLYSGHAIVQPIPA